jgi:hypothetical protein
MKRLIKKVAVSDSRASAILYIDGEIMETDEIGIHNLLITNWLEKKRPLVYQLIDELADDPEKEKAYYDEHGELDFDFLYDKVLVSDRMQYMPELSNILDRSKTAIAFAHRYDEDSDNGEHRGIYIEANTLFNVDMNTIVQAMKSKFPDYDIYEANSDSHDGKKVARLRKKD